MKNLNKKNKGFTLIEILVVLGIIAILAAIVIVAVNPAENFQKATAATRSAGANSIVNAIGQYIVGENGVLTDLSLPTAGTAKVEITTANSGICADIIPEYSGTLPTDPDSTFKGAAVTACTATGVNIGYTIEQPTAGQIVVCSSYAPTVCGAL